MPAPRARRLAAVAYDGQGTPVARAAATVYRELPLVLEAEVPGPGSGDGGPGSADPDEFASALDPRSSEDPNAASDEGGAPTPEGGPVPHPGPVLAPGPILVEGVADLAFQSAPGGAWTVVDFKTDTLEDDRPGSEERGAVYRHQVALYAAAVSRATGLPAVPALLFV